MKDLGFKYSTRAGITIGMSDIVVLHDKDNFLDAAQEKVDKVLQQFRRGLITEEERYDRVISYWVKRKTLFRKTDEIFDHEPNLYDE